MSILSIGLVQRTGNQCHDRPCAMIGQVPVQLETISPMGIAWKAISSKYRYDNFVFIMSTTNTTITPTNLFCSHWVKPKAHRRTEAKVKKGHMHKHTHICINIHICMNMYVSPFRSSLLALFESTPGGRPKKAIATRRPRTLSLSSLSPCLPAGPS